MLKVIHHDNAMAPAWPLVAAQPGIWVADQTMASQNAYTVAHCVEIPTEITVEDFVWAIRQAVSEADLLHAQFGDDEGIAFQRIPSVISPAQVQGPTCLDFSKMPDADANAHVWMQRDLDQDLRIGSDKPLYRHTLIRVSQQPARWLWYQRYHHLVVDGFSVNELARRVAHLYTQRQRAAQPLPTPFTSFTEVVEEYYRYQRSAAYTDDAAFWQAQAQVLGPSVTLSPHALSEHRPTTQLIRHIATVSSPLFKSPGVGQSTMSRVIAVLALWIGRLSGHDHFTIGHIFMRRLGSSALSACGPVINMLPMNVQLVAEATLDETAAALDATLTQMRRHQRFDAEQIQRDLGHVNEATPLFGIVLNIKLFDRVLEIGGVTAHTQELMTGPVRDLEITPSLDHNGTLTLSLLAHAQRYTQTQLALLTEGLSALVRRIEQAEGASIAQWSALTPAQEAALETINDTTIALPESTLCDALAAQAASTPEAPALCDTTQALTYREVRVEVDALAAQLRAHGATRGRIVAVALPRSVALSIALMAILETGAAYLPLDTGYPDQRLHWMVEDAQPVMLVTTADLRARFQGWAPLVCVDDNNKDEWSRTDEALPIQHACANDPAYVLYTSGSTGKPKGVVISHRAIVNRLRWMQHRYPLSGGDTVLQKTPCSFDVSVWEFFWPLMTGARLVMAPPEAHRDPEQLATLIAQYRVTTLHFVPSMLSAFLDALTPVQRCQCREVRQVFCSGEALSTALARQWETHIGCALHNLYGPTEAAIDVSYYPAYGDALARLTTIGVPIGYPVWNTQLYILDPHLQPVPPGVAGELYIKGVQLADGYLHRPELTAARFIVHPTRPQERLYRTGDIARWNDTGAIEYLGRNDDQLKLRGQRIELGEIENALCGLSGVAQAVVVAHAMDNAHAQVDTRQLIGYVIWDSPAVCEPEALRSQLRMQLPPHLVPAHILCVEAWPLSANGKLDRKALPAPEAAVSHGRLPAQGLETQIASAFEALLAHTPVHADDDFFALGGHSLLAMQLVARLRRVLKRSISVGQLMETSTVAQLAAVLALPEQSQPLQAGFEAILPLRRQGNPTVFCLHPASGFAWQFSVLLRYLDNEWDIVGLQSPNTSGPMAQAASLEAVCEQQLAQIQTQQPRGPYFLLGYSLGGTLAQAIAARLCAQGEQVAFLGLLDTYPPESRAWGGDMDHEVIAEIARERERFMNSARQGLDEQAQAQQQAMFTAIEQNYAHAIRLLGTARSPYFNGTATLFIAEHTCSQSEEVTALWQPYVARLESHRLPCAHVDMMSATVFEHLGPELNRALRNSRYPG